MKADYILSYKSLGKKADYNCIYQVEKGEVETMMPLTKQLLEKIENLVNLQI